MEYYFLFLLVAAVSGGTYTVKHVQPISYQYLQNPYYYSQHPYVYQHPPVQFVSHVPAVPAVKAAPGVTLVAGAAPVLTTIESSILTDEDHHSTILVENSPAKPAVQVLSPVLYKFASAYEKAVAPLKAVVKADDPMVEVVSAAPAVVKADDAMVEVVSAAPAVVKADDPMVEVVSVAPAVVKAVAPAVSYAAVAPAAVAPVAPLAYTAVAPVPLAGGYVAINPGATHQAPLPVGPSGDGFYASHHINLPNDVRTITSRKIRSAPLAVHAVHVAAVAPAAVHAVHVAAAAPAVAITSAAQYLPAYPHLPYHAPFHTLSYPYPHVYHAPAFPYNTPVIDTPYLKTLPVAAPVPYSHIIPHAVAPVVKVEVPAAAPGYVAVNPGAVHTAPLPVGPSEDGFYASHHVNLK